MEPILNSQLPEFSVQAFHNGAFKTVTNNDLKGLHGAACVRSSTTAESGRRKEPVRYVRTGSLRQL